MKPWNSYICSSDVSQMSAWSNYYCCVLAEIKKISKKNCFCASQKNQQKISKKSAKNQQKISKKSAKNRSRKHTSSPDVQKNRFSRAEFFAAHANSWTPPPGGPANSSILILTGTFAFKLSSSTYLLFLSTFSNERYLLIYFLNLLFQTTSSTFAHLLIYFFKRTVSTYLLSTLSTFGEYRNHTYWHNGVHSEYCFE